MNDTPETPVEAYNHVPEASFEDNLVSYFEAIVGESAVEQQHYQPDVQWFCDLRVDYPSYTLFIEIENDADSVRDGTSQAAAYSAADPVKGVPMVVAPAGHLPDPERLQRLRHATNVLIRAFDAPTGQFVRVGSDTMNAIDDTNDCPYLIVYERSGEDDYVAAYSRDGVDQAGDSALTYVDRIELPHQMAEPAAFRWLATNDDAYDLLEGMIGPEGADQLCSDTRKYRFGDEEDN